MKVFVAGASGAIGRPLVRAAGRGRARGDGDDAARGAGGGDPRGGRDGGRLRRLRRARRWRRRSRRPRPEVVVHQLTALPRATTTRARIDYWRRPTGCAARGRAT